MSEEKIDFIRLKIFSSDKSDNNKTSGGLLVSINKQLCLGDYNIAFLIKDEPEDNQWIIDSDGHDAGYITFMLNDPLTLKRLFGKELAKGKRLKVTKTMLSSIRIPAEVDHISSYYSIMELLFQKLFLMPEQSELGKLNLDILSSIRLALSFELHQYKLMHKLEVSIFDYWKALVDRHKMEISKIFDDLMSPDNELMNNVRRFQLFLSLMRKELEDGLATE